MISIQQRRAKMRLSLQMGPRGPTFEMSVEKTPCAYMAECGEFFHCVEKDCAGSLRLIELLIGPYVLQFRRLTLIDRLIVKAMEARANDNCYIDPLHGFTIKPLTCLAGSGVSCRLIGRLRCIGSSLRVMFAALMHSWLPTR